MGFKSFLTAVLALILVALGAAYFTGALDPYITEVMEYYFKAKAKAEGKALEAKGEKAGIDFAEGNEIYFFPQSLVSRMLTYAIGELKGNKQLAGLEKEVGGGLL
jgi:hypothetical protein